MSLSYRGENIPEMYDELIRLRAQRKTVVDVIREANAAIENGDVDFEWYVDRMTDLLRELETGGGDE